MQVNLLDSFQSCRSGTVSQEDHFQCGCARTSLQYQPTATAVCRRPLVSRFHPRAISTRYLEYLKRLQRNSQLEIPGLRAVFIVRSLGLCSRRNSSAFTARVIYRPDTAAEQQAQRLGITGSAACSRTNASARIPRAPRPEHTAPDSCRYTRVRSK